VAHPLVDQLRFTRAEWSRALEGVGEADGRRRLEPMNSISWMVGHMAWHEQLCWIVRPGQPPPAPELDELVGNGKPPSTPPLAEMRAAWAAVVAASDLFLDRLTSETLASYPLVGGRPSRQSWGTLVQRVTYHYWFHIGEVLAARQLLGHRSLPEFVGDLHVQAPYRGEQPG
jgi:hypothetical protein